MNELQKCAFKADLMKNFRQLKESRAESVAEDVETVYKRRIEDLCQEIRRYTRQREDLMLDLAPSTAMSNAVVPADFKPETFLEADLTIGVNKRNAIIKLEILTERYEQLFGPISDTRTIRQALPGWKSLYEETADKKEE